MSFFLPPVSPSLYSRRGYVSDGNVLGRNGTLSRIGISRRGVAAISAMNFPGIAELCRSTQCPHGADEETAISGGGREREKGRLLFSLTGPFAEICGGSRGRSRALRQVGTRASERSRIRLGYLSLVNEAPRRSDARQRARSFWTRHARRSVGRGTGVIFQRPGTGSSRGGCSKPRNDDDATLSSSAKQGYHFFCCVRLSLPVPGPSRQTPLPSRVAEDDRGRRRRTPCVGLLTKSEKA